MVDDDDNPICWKHMSRDDDVFYCRKIEIMTDTGKIISLRVSSWDTIGSVKLKIQEENHVPFDQQELIFNERVLENIDILVNLGIKKGSTLLLKCKSSELMNIYIKSRDGLIIRSLEVKLSDTIGHVKAKIPGTGHILTFNERVIEDNDTALADLHIVNGTILTLGHKPVNLSVSLSDKAFSLSVNPTCTIADVKKEIKYVKDIPCDEQVLIFSDMVLDDSSSLFNLLINTKSALKLMRKAKGLMVIEIDVRSDVEAFDLYVNPSDTIRTIKAKIERELVDIPCDEQELIYNEMVLHDSGTLADFHIEKKTRLTLLRLSRGFMKIYIKTHSGETFTLDVKRSGTIHDVKAKLEDKECIRLSRQRLTFSNKILVDNATLADYDVYDGQTFQLVI